ncbi:MAG: hypothetical protein LAO20_13345 [Acidobacteriia bacterium]|nr:hypothetical protein [Terriglobia bacterium]
MAGTSVVFTESEALKYLAKEQWNREGNLLVSQNFYGPAAVNQYREPLSAKTRDTIGFDTREDSFRGIGPDSRRLVLKADAAERFFPKGTLNIINDSPKGKGRPR